MTRTKHGVGEIFTVEFYPQREQSEVNYTEEQDNEKDLMVTEPKEYCMLICKRMHYLLKENSNCEILKLRAEFMRDDDGKIWFTYAPELLIKQ